MIENLREALKGIFSHKMRSFLTMLGVIIGIASILAIVSIVEGTSRKLQKSLIGAGNNVTNVTLQHSEDGSDESYDSDSLITSLTPVSSSSMREIKSISGVEDASVYISTQMYDGISYKDTAFNSSTVNIYGVSKDYFRTIESRLDYGRNFTKEEYDSADKVCIIDDKVCTALFDGNDPTGQVLEIKGEPFTIVGVIGKNSDDQEQDFESVDDYQSSLYSDNTSIYLPMKTFAIPVSFDAAQSVAIRVSDTKLMKSVGNQAADILNMEAVPDGYAYKSQTTAADDNSLKTLTTAITAMLVSIASLSLLVGGIGVMNIMLVSVSERTAEIGLKKALGAKRRDILAQFLTESAVLTGVGGLIGLLIGIIIARIISMLLQLEFAVPLPWVLISLAFSLAIGIFFGVAPASKASKLNPIDALRRE